MTPTRLIITVTSDNSSNPNNTEFAQSLIESDFCNINPEPVFLKENGIEITSNRISKKWFVEGDKAKFFFLCDDANKATSEEAADNALNALKKWNGLKNLNNIKNQTLIIWGDKDTAYNFDQVDTLNKNIPNSKIKIIKNCSHNVHLEVPEEFNEIVKKFIDD